MSLARKIFYNTLAQSVGKVFAAAIGIVTVAALSRHLRAQGFGEYSTVIAFLGVFATLADLGLYLIVTREISKPDVDRAAIISNALGLRLATTLVFLLSGAGLAWLLPYAPAVRQTMFIGAASFVFVSLTQVLVGVFQKHLIQHWLVAAETSGRLVNLLLIYLFIAGDLPLPFFLLALLCGNAAHFFLAVLFARRRERFHIAFNPKEWKKLLTASWPLAFAVILNLLYFRTDIVILSWFHPAKSVGIYAFPYKNLEGLLSFPAMFVGLLMPLLSKTAFHNWTDFRKYLQGGFDALAVMAVPVVIGVAFFGKPILDLLNNYQPGFADSPALMTILTLAAVAIFFGTLFSYAVVAVDRQKTMLHGYLLAAVVALVWYFAFIPNFGYWAAAWGTVISELIVAIYAYLLVRRVSRQGVSLKILWRLLPAALFMTGFYVFADLSWLLEIFLGLGIYIAGLLAFRAVSIGFIKELLFPT